MCPFDKQNICNQIVVVLSLFCDNSSQSCSHVQNFIKLSFFYNDSSITGVYDKLVFPDIDDIMSNTWTLQVKRKWLPFYRPNFQITFVWMNVLRGKMSLEFVPMRAINNNPALVQMMAWQRLNDNPFPAIMMPDFRYAYIRHPALVSWNKIVTLWYRWPVPVTLASIICLPKALYWMQPNSKMLSLDLHAGYHAYSYLTVYRLRKATHRRN